MVPVPTIIFKHVKIKKNCLKVDFLWLNFTCWIRIRISNTAPDPAGDLNMDPHGSGTLRKDHKRIDTGSMKIVSYFFL